MQKTVNKSTSLPSLSLISTPLNIITLVSDAYILATNLILMLLGRKWLIPIQYQYLSIDDTTAGINFSSYLLCGALHWYCLIMSCDFTWSVQLTLEKQTSWLNLVMPL